jgi:hypothetical protein
MNEAQISKQVQHFIQQNSGHEEQRQHLGMSSIGRCPRRVYDEFIAPQKPDEAGYRGFYLGHMWEYEVKDILEGAKVYRPDSERELIAPFDPRFKGHTDGETTWGDLLEIKSVTSHAMEKVKSEGRVRRDHFYQAQAYMRYGGYTQALFALVCRDPFEFYFVNVEIVRSAGERLESKARSLLASIDARRRPACECGHCR